MTRRRVRWLVGGITALLVAIALALWAWRQPAPTVSLLKPDDDDTVALGQRIYAQHCASCHGAQGEGQPHWRERGADGLLPAPPHDESGHTWHHPDAQLIAITKYSLARVINQPGYLTAMPAYEGTLSDAEIVAVLSWIKAQWPPAVRRHHDQINAQAARAD